jgi:VanZ family protein
MPQKISRFLPVVLWMVLIYVVSSIPELPSNDIDVVDFIFKKTAHFLEYSILFILWYRAIGEKNPTKAIIFSLIYAFTDEIHQLLVPGRTGRLRDVGIDALGIITTSILIVKLNLWKPLLSPLHSKKPGK